MDELKDLPPFDGCALKDASLISNLDSRKRTVFSQVETSNPNG